MSKQIMKKGFWFKGKSMDGFNAKTSVVYNENVIIITQLIMLKKKQPAETSYVLKRKSKWGYLYSRTMSFKHDSIARILHGAYKMKVVGNNTLNLITEL